MLLMAGGSGAGVTALASWAASTAVRSGTADYARIVTMVDLAGASDESARCSALVEAFGEASQAGRAILVLDDVDRMVAGTGPNGASAAVLGTLRALLREPMHVDAAAQVSRPVPAVPHRQDWPTDMHIYGLCPGSAYVARHCHHFKWTGGLYIARGRF